MDGNNTIGMTQYKIEDLRLLETMANTDEFAHGEHLINVLKTRKELAKRMLKSGYVSEVELKETQGAINYCNHIICQVMGIPSGSAKV